METDDRGENDGRRRGNLKENSPLSYIKVHPQMASEKQYKVMYFVTTKTLN
jgi:hypothetical protein